MNLDIFRMTTTFKWVRLSQFLILSVLCGLLVACDSKPQPEANPARDQPGSLESPYSIYTVNYPLQYFAQRMGGDFVIAHYPGPSDEDPAYWKPDIDTVVEYQQSDLIILNGVGYASWVRQMSLPLSKQVDTSAGFADQLLPVTDKVAHTHGPTGEHVHDDLAFTVWLDPELASLQAKVIHAALLALLPDQTEVLDANLLALTEELQALDKDLAEAFRPKNARQIIYSHPVYQYLDRRYELNGISVHWEPEAVPSAGEFKQLENMSGSVMIWEAEPLPEVQARLTDMGIASVVFSPCATQPDSGPDPKDYLQVMQANVDRINNALR